MTSPIKLVLCDIDGCLNAGLNDPLDLIAISSIARQIEAFAGHGVLCGLCTGRPVPFAQAMAQVLGTTAPLVCENGAVVFDPECGRAIMLPAPSDIEALRNLGARIVQSPRWDVTLEPGKSACVSLNGARITGARPDHIKAVIGEMQALPNANNFNWTFSSTAIDVTPKGIDKSVGAQRLLASLGMDWSCVAAIGDSEGDLPVLKRAALSLCPANATDAVKQIVDHCADLPFAGGTAQLLQTKILAGA